jgi:transcriptional regulator
MHPNAIFQKAPREKNIAFARERSFGILAVNSDTGPLLSHIPFHLSSDGKNLEAHLVRSNPILRLLAAPVDAVIAVSGGDAYISPDWYGVENQVPTWNYVAVHLRGKLRRLETGELRGILDRLSEEMEGRLAPKHPWKIDKMDKEIFEKMRRQIVAITLDVTGIDGTWKSSQNKSTDARTGAAIGAGDGRIGSDTDGIVAQMRDEGMN